MYTKPLLRTSYCEQNEKFNLLALFRTIVSKITPKTYFQEATLLYIMYKVDGKMSAAHFLTEHAVWIRNPIAYIDSE
jgi:hypothetical protein